MWHDFVWESSRKESLDVDGGNSIKCHINETESELKGVKLIHLAQDRDK
jgi:hypothetical protein